ncbi:MAG: bacteriocin [Oceanospirillaceae bacterium]|nr:bacteriocin [Oceanospirillaceae bacterium]|tara:strand:+ start:868 stop:1107 length:240 start_codon:yes stop_codon:yes gene_type:complete
MGYGLVNVQRGLDQEAKAGLADAAALEQQRKMTNDQLEQADKAGQMNAVATGAGLGFAVGGPVGAGVGAAAGYLMYEFL